MTKDGKDYEIDFKIDTFRNEIRLNKYGSTKRLMTERTSANGNNQLQRNNSSYLDLPGGDYGLADVDKKLEILHTDTAVLATDPDVVAAQAYIHSLGGMASVERYKQVEDLI